MTLNGSNDVLLQPLVSDFWGDDSNDIGLQVGIFKPYSQNVKTSVSKILHRFKPNLRTMVNTTKYFAWVVHHMFNKLKMADWRHFENFKLPYLSTNLTVVTTFATMTHVNCSSCSNFKFLRRHGLLDRLKCKNTFGGKYKCNLAAV